jgi:hypothetical protein
MLKARSFGSLESSALTRTGTLSESPYSDRLVELGLKASTQTGIREYRNSALHFDQPHGEKLFHVGGLLWGQLPASGTDVAQTLAQVEGILNAIAEWRSPPPERRTQIALSLGRFCVRAMERCAQTISNAALTEGCGRAYLLTSRATRRWSSDQRGGPQREYIDPRLQAGLFVWRF